MAFSGGAGGRAVQKSVGKAPGRRLSDREPVRGDERAGVRRFSHRMIAATRKGLGLRVWVQGFWIDGDG
jgi:hypothetical protein